MKKMFKLLSMVLAVAMLLTSTVALAEGTIPMNYIEIGNIDLTIDGESLMDLSPLKLKLGAGMSDMGTEMALTADLIAGESNALSAVAGMADGKVLANVEGMSKPLGLDLATALSEENLMAMYNMFMSELTAEEQAALMEIVAGVQLMASEEGLASIEDAYMNYMGTAMDAMSDNIAVEECSNEFYCGLGEEEPAIKTTMVLTGEDMALVMDEAIKFYDNIPGLLQVLNGIAVLGGEEPIESYAALVAEEDLTAVYEGIELVFDIYENMDDSLIDMVINVMADNGAEEMESVATIDVGIGVTESIDVLMQIADVNGDGMFASFNVVPSETFAGESEAYIYLENTIDGESIPLMNGFIGPDADYGTLGAFELNSGSEEDAMGIAWGMDEGQYIFSIYDAYTSIEMGYIQETEDAAMVYLNMDESGTVMEISANVSVSSGEMAAADLVKLAQGGFVDVMTAGDAEYEQVAQDLTTVGMSAVMTVAANVPDLMMMLMGE